METFEGKKAYAVYSEFGVSSEAGKYKLSVKGFSGDADDHLKNHNGHMFSTYDADNDNHGGICCACHYRVGWWFNDFIYAHLNGKYYYKHETVVSSPRKVYWGTLALLKYGVMKIH
ncbi:hypothetical protein DPMN_003184 [Dreissena polymorpha]|uniref:Fibrinogen C-terminal domain-containing protein n=1 Tax=Dreissena polymorpha TaxID=45954 RepID=A0A9D4MPG5_DREPO|nr:hypothetical protein DPMN_003184 [Dreissena polymorpha]